MARLSGKWLLCLLLAASLTAAASSAIDFPDPAQHSNPVYVEFVKNLKNRNGHVLQSDTSYSKHIRSPPTLLTLIPSIAFPSDQELIRPNSYSNRNFDEYIISSKMLKLAVLVFVEAQRSDTLHHASRIRSSRCISAK